MKNLWFIDVKSIQADELTTKLQHFSKIHNFFINKNNLIILNHDFQISSENDQYLMIRDFFDGDEVKFLMKYIENPNDIVNVIVFVKKRRLMEIKNKISSKRFNRYLKEIIGMKIE